MLVMESKTTKTDKTKIEFKTEKGEVVGTQKAIKILGWWTNGRRLMDTHLSKTLSKVWYSMTEYSCLTAFMNEKSELK